MVSCDIRNIKISRNLRDVVCTFWKERFRSPLWTDSTRIDQDNVDETTAKFEVLDSIVLGKSEWATVSFLDIWIFLVIFQLPSLCVHSRDWMIGIAQEIENSVVSHGKGICAWTSFSLYHPCHEDQSLQVWLSSYEPHPSAKIQHAMEQINGTGINIPLSIFNF